MSAIALSGECTIYEIAQLHQKIHDNWKAGTNLELDVSAVSEVDASFIQLLASCKKRAEAHEVNLLLNNPTDALNEKIKAMFMIDYFAADPETD